MPHRRDGAEDPALAAVVGADLRAARSAFVATEDLLPGEAAEVARAGYGRRGDHRQQCAQAGTTAQHGGTITDRGATCQFKPGVRNRPTRSRVQVAATRQSRYLPSSGASLLRTSRGIFARSDQIASASADWHPHSPWPDATTGSARRM